MRRFQFVASASVLLATAAVAVPPVVDGTLDPVYGSPIVVQSVDTQFGDANPPGNLGGSELNAAYAHVAGGRLYFMLTGNHEPNFNKLDVFIDSRAGGENQLSGTPGYDFSPNGGISWISQNMAGMRFDAGFNADYHLLSRWGNGSGPYEVDFVDRFNGVIPSVPGSRGVGSNAVGLVSTGTIPAGQINAAGNASSSAVSQNLDFAINNNNNGGVIGGTGAANQAAAAAVTTGMEFSIALADLGNPADGTQIKIFAAINNGDHNYMSNQVLGGLPAGQGNLGGDGNGGFTGTLGGVDFNNFAGDQWFSVTIPEPASLSLLVLGGLLAIRRR